ncbi:MAG: bacteriohemerythrin [Isosphaeraceae bacterium]
MAIEWSEKFSTGNPEIDAQHRRLFDMLNNLERRINDGESPSEMMDVFDDLVEYTKVHFANEEQCMSVCACATQGINKLAHHGFLRMISSRLEHLRLQDPTLKVFKSLHSDLSDWVCNHICRIVRAMRV